MPDTGLLAPARTLVAVRAIAPVTGMPPNMTEAILAVPCATNSQFERCRRPVMPSATTAESSDSIAPSKAMARASGRSSRILARSKTGSVGAGRLCGTPPNLEPMVATSRPSSPVNAAHSATAINMPGHAGRKRRTAKITATASADRAAVRGWMAPREAHRTDSLGNSSAGSLAMSRPSNSLSWLAKMMTAMPAVNPTVTG